MVILIRMVFSSFRRKLVFISSMRRNTFEMGRHTRGFNHRGLGSTNSNEQGVARQGNPNKPPPHLKGRDIGLFYRNKQVDKSRRLDQKQRAVISIEPDLRRRFDAEIDRLQNEFPVFADEFERNQESSVSNWTSKEEVDLSQELPRKNRTDYYGSSDVATSSNNCVKSEQEEDSLFDEPETVCDDTERRTPPSGENGKQQQSQLLDDIVVDELITENALATTLSADEPFFEPISENRPVSCSMDVTERIRIRFASKSQSANYKRMQQLRSGLPAVRMRDVILETIDKNQVTVVVGETGCGKSTQVPQLILESRASHGQSPTYVAVTQPRRIAATSLAKCVAEQLDERPGGNSVGYQIRLEARRPGDMNAGILYCTTGILLQWMLSDRRLSRVTHLVLDEVHERDLSTDFLMMLVRDLIITGQRPDLKVILMSATMNEQKLVDYFSSSYLRQPPGVVRIEGRLHPVTAHFLEDILEMTSYQPQEQRRPLVVDELRALPRKERRQKETEYWREVETFVGALMKRSYSMKTQQILSNWDESKLDLELITELTDQICKSTDPDEGILIFVPGWWDITHLKRRFEAHPRLANPHHISIVPLHGLLPNVDQRKVFDKPPHGVRKIVIATNIAETSITVEDIVHVIDTGKIKMTNYNSNDNLQTLRAEWCSQANCAQRRGRAGRVRPGHCYHLFTSLRDGKMSRFGIPEMLRTQLESLCLQIKRMKLGSIERFLAKAPDPPDSIAIQRSIEELVALGALRWDREELTGLGWHLSKLPMDPHCGKMIIYGALFGCLEPILTIASCLDYKEPFSVPFGKEELVDAAKVKLSKDENGIATLSDHLMFHNAISQYKQHAQPHRFAYDHFLNIGTVSLIEKMKVQFGDLLAECDFVPRGINIGHQSMNRNSDNERVIRAVLCAGLYPRVAETKALTERQLNKSSEGKGRPLLLYSRHWKRLVMHSASVNKHTRQLQTRHVCFHKVMKSSSVYIYDSSAVSPMSLILFGGALHHTTERNLVQDDNTASSSSKQNRSDQEVLVLDGWIRFQCDRNTSKLCFRIRSALDALLSLKLDASKANEMELDSKTFLDLIVNLLSQEQLGCV